MSKVLQEGDLVFDFAAAIVSDQFDDPSTHKLAHCMKAVDFIVEWEHEFGMRMRFIVPLTVKTPVQTKTGQVEAQVDLAILAVCAEHPLSSSGIAAALGHKKLSGNLRKALPRLKKAGMLEYTIPDKPNSRLQKYRLTPKGKAVIMNESMDSGQLAGGSKRKKPQ